MDEFTRSQPATVAIAPPFAASQVPGEDRFIPGTLFAGRYRIVSLLGSGGMGEVYRATDLTLAQPVALKFLADSAASARMLELFHNEVRVARQVSHPNVCRVYDVGESAGLPYISMEYVDGEDLATLLQRIGRLPSGKALEIARKVCAGVAAAHDKGVIHRDLKPANVMLDRRGNVVVMDFGLAAIAHQLLGAEARSGTPAYMAPEQLRGEEATAKSDIYALGLMLYELFTGKRAYEAVSVADLVRQQEIGQIASMSAIAAEIDPAVEIVIRRCLDPLPARRPANALSIAAALPGGDPLAAALAAGQTPSPDLVAASGKTEALRLTRSVPLFLVLVGALIAIPFARTNVEVHSLVPMDLSADALAAKVRDYAATLGYPAFPADRKYDLHWQGNEFAYLQKNVHTAADQRRWARIEPPLQLGYRESPLPLIALPDGEVTKNRPAPTLSGMIEAWVNSKGELRRFSAVPPQIDSPAASSEIDPLLLSRLAGIDISQWPETQPPQTPLYAFDRLKAWRGRHPSLGIDLTVQASSWHGRITELDVIWPWTEPERVPSPRGSLSGNALGSLVYSINSAIAFLFSAFLAIRNLKAKRGDLRGAGRLAIAFLIMGAVIWLFSAHWVADVALLEIFTANAAEWVVSAGLVWLLYVALEPAVRARWPHSIVSWSRVLIGRWSDPLVGAHVLYGGLVGVVIAFMFVATQAYGAAHGEVGGTANASSSASAQYWIAYVVGQVRQGVESGLLFIFAIFCCRFVLRKDWAAALAAALLFSLAEGEALKSPFNFVFFLVLFTLLVFVLLRLGLVSTMIAVFFVDILLQTPGAQTLSKPYEWAVIMYPALAIAIALWAFWQASGSLLINPQPEPETR